MASDRRGPLDRDLIRRVPALRRHVVVSSIAAGLGAIMIVAQAEIIARTLNSVVDGSPRSLLRPAVALVFVGLGRAAVTASIEWSGATAMARVRLEMRQAVLDHAAVDAARERPGVAAREAAVGTSGIDRLDAYVRDYLPALTTAVAVPLAAGARILSLDWISAAIVAVTVPLIPVFMVLIGQLTERRSQRQWAVLQRLTGNFLDVLEGLPTLRLFGRASAQAASVRRVSEEYRLATMATLRIAFLSALVLELLATLSVAVVAVSIGLRLANGSVGLETALVVLLLAPECYLPLRRVGAAFHAAEAGHDAADDVRSVLGGPVFASGHARPVAAQAINIRGLRAPGRRTLSDGVDLDLEPGTVTVLHGPSGSGKSTVLAALRGRLAGATGTIRVGQPDVNPVDLADLDPDAWAELVAVADQRPEPMTTIVWDEVRGATDAGRVAMADALGAVGLGGLADDDPASLSGGQLRRVQVARVVVAVAHGTARVVLADEPTAQLDTANAELVRSVLVDLARSRGAIVVVATHDQIWHSVADQLVDLTVDQESVPTRGRRVDQSPAWDTSDDAMTYEPPVNTDGLAAAAVADPGVEAVAGRRWVHLRSILGPVRRRVALAAGLAITTEVCTLGLAGAAAWLIVRASERPDLAALAVAVTGIRAFGIGKGVFRYAERLASHDVGFRMLGAVRGEVVDRVAAVAPVAGWRRGDLLRRTVDDVDRLLDLVVRIIVPWTAYGVTSLGAVVIIALIDPGAGAIILATVVVIGVALPLVVARHERQIGPGLAVARATLTDRVLDVTERVDLLVGSGLLLRARSRVDTATDEVEQLERRRAIERATSRALIALLPAASVAAVLVVVGPTPTMSAPAYGVVVLWPLAILELLANIGDGARVLPELSASADRVDRLLALRRVEGERIPLAAGSAPSVELRGARARWPASGVMLGPYSVELAAGARATISGPSGSGKSTLAAAMVRFCPIVEGDYVIDDSDALAADPDDVRRTVLWVDQHPWIGDSSLRENLKIGDPAAADERLRDVLDVVELGGWFEALPNGLDTMVGRRGHAVSGGEAHRIGIARALLARQPVVILDEPVSHLDGPMGERVVAAIDTEAGHRSVLVLGHRPLAGFDGTVYDLVGPDPSRESLRSAASEDRK